MSIKTTRHKAQCMADTSQEFFEIRVRQTDSVDVLRKFIEIEVADDCRRDRIGYANKRMMQLKNDKRGTAGNQTAV